MKIVDIDHLKINALLPTPRGVALALLEICQREDVTTNEITKLIKTDPALSSRLIKKANTSHQRSRAILSVSDAVSYLGLNVVKQLALGFSLIDQFHHGACQGFDYQKFWSHSLLMAIAAQNLGKSRQLCPVDELFTCGLMARIGCLTLATVYPEKYTELLEQKTPDTSLIDLEKQYLQTDHNELTAALMINFGIPRIMVEAIYYHEMPNESDFAEDSRPHQILHLFSMAKQIADFGVSTQSDRDKQVPKLVFLGGKLSLDTELFGAFIDQVMDEWQAWCELLKIPAIKLPPFDKMVNAPAPRTGNAEDAISLRVLVVDDDPTNLVYMEGVLSGSLGHTVYKANNGEQALSLAMEVTPHVVITDWLMPVMDGLKLTKSLRATEWGQSLYIIMLTCLEEEDEIIEAFNAGVDDYVIKPINVRAFRARLRAAWHYQKLQESWERDREQLKRFAAELAVTNRKLEYLALTDTLTELPNRRAGTDALMKAWSNANRSNQALYVMLIDVDFFKKVNDTYGHAAGDQVLKKIASALQTSARNSDTFYRVGGEEFMVISQNTGDDTKSIVVFAERLRKHIAALQINCSGSSIQVTVSVGVAKKDAKMKIQDDLLSAADKALYMAKNTGRNKTCLYFQDKILNCDSIKK
ncbi:MAG: diguanylate cyclase [Burkholderiales bacterium]|nr:diguanylate cyclase [Nitrosomonas sp.]MCP5273760.1 diguanylate cyclase [Burkholderiales bacterium]